MNSILHGTEVRAWHCRQPATGSGKHPTGLTAYDADAGHRNFLLAFFTPFITSAIDFRYGYVFAGCNLLGGLLVYFFVVEGQGRTLEELDTMYIQGVLPWESSKWVAPSPDQIAMIRAEAGTSEAIDPEIGLARGDSAIQAMQASEKDSMDSESTSREKMEEREAQEARENEEPSTERRE